MSVKNLHSLLNGQWFIHESYGKSLLPSLYAMMEGKDISTNQPNTAAPEIITALRNGNVAAAGDAGSSNNEYVVILNLKDPIYKYNQECGPQGTKSKMRTLEVYRNDAACVGVVLDIDSGGGQVSGTPEFYDYLLAYGKPVVSYTDGYMCSAAYYIGSAAKHIIANKRADHIGSIGAMVHFIDVTGIYEKMGATIVTEYATKSTQKNRDYENLLKGKPEEYIKNQLDPIVDSFHADMKAVRSNLDEEVLAGGTWNAEGSLARGLVDELGTLQTAVDKVFELAAAQNSNQNPDNMSKPRANVQAVLGLTVPLVSTADKGSYLNEEQLDTIETSLADAEANAATLQTSLDEATAAQTKAEGDLTTATAAHTAETTATETAVDTMLTDAGLPVAGTLPEKLTSLSSHFAVLNKNDGATHTTTRTDGKPGAGAKTYLDKSAAHNQLANELYK